MSEEWGPWIEHDGRGCPVPVGTHVLVYSESDGEMEAVAGMTSLFSSTYKAHGLENDPAHSKWKWVLPDGRYFGIIRYRVRRPRALHDLIEMVESLPAPPQPVSQPVEVVS